MGQMAYFQLESDPTCRKQSIRERKSCWKRHSGQGYAHCGSWKLGHTVCILALRNLRYALYYPHLFHLSLTPSFRPMPKGPWSGSCGGPKVPPFHNFFIHQDRRLNFDMHIVHEKRNTIIRICVGQLTQGSGNGWQRVVTDDDGTIQVTTRGNV